MAQSHRRSNRKSVRAATPNSGIVPKGNDIFNSANHGIRISVLVDGKEIDITSVVDPKSPKFFKTGRKGPLQYFGRGKKSPKFYASSKLIANAIKVIEYQVPVVLEAMGEPVKSQIKLDAPSAVTHAEGKGLARSLSQGEAMDRLKSLTPELSLEEWAGPVLGPQDLFSKLRIARSTLHDWRRNRQIIGLLRGTRKHVFPVAQFVDGRPVEGIARVLKIITNPRTAWLWLIEGAEGGLPTNLDRLKAGDIDGVVNDARETFG